MKLCVFGFLIFYFLVSSDCLPVEQTENGDFFCYNCIGSVEECGDINKKNLQEVKCDASTKCATYLIKYDDTKTAIMRQCDNETSACVGTQSFSPLKKTKGYKALRLECTGPKCNKEIYSEDDIMKKISEGLSCTGHSRIIRQDDMMMMDMMMPMMPMMPADMMMMPMMPMMPGGAAMPAGSMAPPGGAKPSAAGPTVASSPAVTIAAKVTTAGALNKSQNKFYPTFWSLLNVKQTKKSADFDKLRYN